MYLDGINEPYPSNGGQQMFSKNQFKVLWVVVKVESGIPVMIEAYGNKKSARMRERDLRRYMHPENDETGVFEIPICGG